MTPDLYQHIAARFSSLHVAVLGDFCLDRYFEIDPARAEVSIETGLPVHNVVRVRSQPGGAGTVLNNLAALGIGKITPIGFCGDDGEGYELRRALAERPGVTLQHLVPTSDRCTFTYGKPLVVAPGQVPVELNRLDIKNWTPTPAAISDELAERVAAVGRDADALIVLDQVDVAETGVVTSRVLQAVEQLAASRPKLLILADSRRGLGSFPQLDFKMNHRELAAMQTAAVSSVTSATSDHEPARSTAAAVLPTPSADVEFAAISHAAMSLAQRTARHVFVTLAEGGIVGAFGGSVEYSPAWPVRGPIDIVGAGDAVTANLTASLAAGSSLAEALQIAMAAASIVIHQLGTTGTASPMQIVELLGSSR